MNGCRLERSLADWTTERIDAECEDAYAAYFGQVRLAHIAYFAGRSELRSKTCPFAVHTREVAFPAGWEHLADTLPEDAWHRHHLSAGSSQVLAVALLSSATQADSLLRWLPGERHLRRPTTLFEVELAPGVLNEQPRQTSLDWLVVDPGHVITAEAKFTERGLGQCSCARRKAGVCSTRVLARPYWTVASRDMALVRNEQACSLSLAYQAVRNVAAAQSIARRRTTTFLLLYDERNPYFVGAQAWPGWVIMLKRLMRKSSTAFASLSWQDLLAKVDVDADVRAWAREKHGI